MSFLWKYITGKVEDTADEVTGEKERREREAAAQQSSGNVIHKLQDKYQNWKEAPTLAKHEQSSKQYSETQQKMREKYNVPKEEKKKSWW